MNMFYSTNSGGKGHYYQASNFTPRHRALWLQFTVRSCEDQAPKARLAFSTLVKILYKLPGSCLSIDQIPLGETKL